MVESELVQLSVRGKHGCVKVWAGGNEALAGGSCRIGESSTSTMIPLPFLRACFLWSNGFKGCQHEVLFDTRFVFVYTSAWRYGEACVAHHTPVASVRAMLAKTYKHRPHMTQPLFTACLITEYYLSDLFESSTAPQSSSLLLDVRTATSIVLPTFYSLPWTMQRARP